MAEYYCSSARWTAVTPWAASTVVTVGDIRRQLAVPTINNERVWRCTTGGTTGASEPSWSLSVGSTTNDNGVVWTNITGSSTYNAGGVWAAPFARLHSLDGTINGGDTCWIGSDHAETRASAGSITFGGTSSSPARYLCVDVSLTSFTHSDLRTTATVTTTGNSAMTLGGGGANRNSYVYGVTFSAGSGANSPDLNFDPQGSLMLENCKLITGGTSGGRISFGNSASRTIRLRNTTVKFNSTSSFITMFGGMAEWLDTPSAIDVTGSIPTTLFQQQSNPMNIYVRGVDLSALGSGKTLCGNIGNLETGRIVFDGCSLGASAASVSQPSSTAGMEIVVVNTDNVGKECRHEFWNSFGRQIVESTLKRTGGASDINGDGFSWNLSSQSNSSWWVPFTTLTMSEKNSATGASKTLTVEGIWHSASGALPTNAQLWLEAHYYSSSSYPLKSTVNSGTASPLQSGTNLTASTEAWDSGVTARANSTSYSVGNLIKVASNPGRVFYCTTGGTSAGSEPAGFATAVDGGSVTDNGAVFRAMVRFKMSVSFTPQMAGYVEGRVKLANPSTSNLYICPSMALA